MASRSELTRGDAGGGVWQLKARRKAMGCDASAS